MESDEFTSVCIRRKYINILRRVADDNKRSLANQLEIILDEALELKVEA